MDHQRFYPLSSPWISSYHVRDWITNYVAWIRNNAIDENCVTRTWLLVYCIVSKYSLLSWIYRVSSPILSVFKCHIHVRLTKLHMRKMKNQGNMTMTANDTSCSKMAELETIHKDSHPPAGVGSEANSQFRSSKGCSHSNGASWVSARHYISVRVQELLQKPQRRHCLP